MANHPQASLLCAGCRKPSHACTCAQTARQFWNNGSRFLSPHQVHPQQPLGYSQSSPARQPPVPYFPGSLGLSGSFAPAHFDPRMFPTTHYYPPLPHNAVLTPTRPPPVTPHLTRNPMAFRNPPAESLSPTQQISQDSRKKRKRGNEVSVNTKRSRTADENTDPSAITVHGIGPASTPIHKPTHQPEPIAQRASSSARSGSENHESKQGASDVWYFMRPLETRTKPNTESVPPSPLSRKKPASKFVGCCLCKFPDEWHTWSNVNGMADTIRKHLIKYHGDEWRQRVIAERLKGWEEMSKANKKSGPAATSKIPFTLEGFVQRLARWIVVDDQSLNVVECEELRELLLYISADLEDSDIPHRTKITETIFKSYETEWNKLVEDLQKSEGRVSTTSDLWSDPNLRPFMALTVHYCSHDKRGNLRVFNRLAAFRYISGNHSGVNLAENFIQILKDLGILHKIGMIMLDNASNCNTMMEHLESLLQDYDISFNAVENRIRCFPHVINISVQAALRELSKSSPSLPRQDSEAPTTLEINKCNLEYELALGADPVAKCRKLVTACRSSGSRREDLQLTITDGNKSRSFPEGQQIRNVQLLRDVETRWSSTFLMISRLLELYPAVDVLLNKVKYKDIHKHLLSEIDLKVLEDIANFLEIPHSVQSILCAEKTPTLPLVLPAYEELLEGLRLFKADYPQLNRAVSIAIAKIEEYVVKSRKNKVYALAMIINPATKLDWIERHWTAEDSANAKKWMLQVMFEFRKADRKKKVSELSEPSKPSKPCPQSAAPTWQSQHRGLSYIKALKVKMQKPGSQSADNWQCTTSSSNQVQTEAELRTQEELADKRDRLAVEEELQRYLLEGLLEEDGLDSNSLTRHWQANKKHYPYMYRVALDILPVQASSVACERVFSSSKETITMRRACLSTSLVEVLQFLKYTYRAERLDLTEGLVSSEEELLRDSDDLSDDVSSEDARDLVRGGEIDKLIELLNTETSRSRLDT